MNNPIDLLRPIFQEVPEDVEEHWNWGVVVGGMASSRLHIARAYKDAADRLVESGLELQDMHQVGYPALFLYRHAIELYLKDACGSDQRVHGLRALIQKVRALRPNLPQWLSQRVEEWDRYDAGSMTFRYHDGGTTTFEEQAELWADLRHLQNVVQAIVEVLDPGGA